MIGTTVSHYSVLERLGGGGMGVVFKAEDTRLKRVVALKFLPPALTSDPKAKERFVQEARAASALDHPHVCTIHEIDETPDGQVFICMAYVDGESLRTRLGRGRMGIEETLAVAMQVAEGLAQAHAHGIVHRDIKPGNLMLTRDGSVKIVDFGLAMLAGQSRITNIGQVVGTAAYMSPEQARGDPVDRRCDLWSLGVVIYEMLTDRLPFLAETDGALLQAIVHNDFPPLEDVRPGLPPQLCAAVKRCLVKDPVDRWQSAAELRADLERVRRALSTSSDLTLTGVEPISATSRRRTAIAAVGGALLLATAVGLSWRPLVRALVGPREPSLQRVLAVLPFTNVGGDPANQGFCDGLPESLTSRLTQLERYPVWVVPFSDVRAAGIASPVKARDGLGVNLAVTGYVQRSQNDVRVTLNLNRVDGATARQVRSRTITEKVSALESIEDEAVWSLAEMLDLELPREARRTPLPGGTTVAEAQERYLEGFGALNPSKGTPDPKTAVELFERAVHLDPTFALAWAGLGHAHLDLFQRAKDPAMVELAFVAARKAAQLNPSLPQVHATLGLIEAAKGENAQAAREFERALALNPVDAGALRGLAGAYEKLGRFDDAEAAYRRAVAAQSDLWPSHQSLANFYWRRSRFPEAEAEYRKAMALDPTNEWLPNNLGAVQFSVGRYDEARAMFERSLAIRPTYGAYSNLGTLAFMRRDWREAIAKYEQAKALDDRDYALWGNIGIAYHWLRDHDGQAAGALRTAVTLAERALSVNPSDPGVLADLASYTATLGEKDRSLAYLRQVEAAGRDQADLAISIADVYADLADREKAIEWIGTAVSLGCPTADVEKRPAFEELLRDPRVQKLLQSSRGGNKP